MLFFDAHLDLAYLAVNKRDMLAPLDPDAGPVTPATITLPSLRAGDVRMALPTIFTELNGRGPEGYPEDDADRAHAAGRAQLEVYLTWRDAGHLSIDLPQVLRHDAGVGEIRAGLGTSETTPPSVESLLARAPSRAPLHVGILMENADPIRTPDELPWWAQRGVVAIGMAWAMPSRYACGNSVEPDEDTGLTDLGRELVCAIDTLELIHDLSHLSDRACDELLAASDRPVIASHSNARSVFNDPHRRNLRDETISEVARRGGVIGLNLYKGFLAHTDKGQRPSVDQTIAHVEHICELVGHRRAVGLGSDMDGGFGATALPAGINAPEDLSLLTGALAHRNWPDEDIRAFAHANFARVIAEHVVVHPTPV